MKEPVIIKNFQNGLHMIMDPELDYDIILNSLADKLEKSRSFFGNAQVALTVSGRQLVDSEEVQLVDTVMEHSSLEVICIMCKDQAANKTYIKALQKILDLIPGSDRGILVEESMRNGARIESPNDVVVLGDVMYGCKVIAGRNVVVMGSLYGEAIAGSLGDDNACVIALEMAPEELTIGSFKYTINKKGLKWGAKNGKTTPQIAFCDGKKIVFEPLTKERVHFS